jgi:hypothetical protein
MGCRLIVVHAPPGFQSYVSYRGARHTGLSPPAQPDAARRHAKEIVDDAVDAVGGDATGVVESGLPWDVLQDVADREDGQAKPCRRARRSAGGRAFVCVREA